MQAFVVFMEKRKSLPHLTLKGGLSNIRIPASILDSHIHWLGAVCSTLNPEPYMSV